MYSRARYLFQGALKTFMDGDIHWTQPPYLQVCSSLVFASYPGVQEIDSGPLLLTHTKNPLCSLNWKILAC